MDDRLKQRPDRATAMHGSHDSPSAAPHPNGAGEATPGSCPLGPALPEGFPASLAGWIRTPCGRAKYLTLASRPGLLVRLRLGWFVLAAALRDLRQPLPGGSPSDGAQEPGRFSS